MRLAAAAFPSASDEEISPDVTCGWNVPTRAREPEEHAMGIAMTPCPSTGSFPDALLNKPVQKSAS
jgi:hypothetical protein